MPTSRAGRQPAASCSSPERVRAGGIKRDAAILAAAVAVGTAAWIVCFASLPRFSYDASENTRSTVFWPAMVALAFAVGFSAGPRSARIGGLLLGLPALLLAPWTAPRGDNDGLWILIVPMLAIFVGVLAVVAHCGGLTREFVGDHRR